ncbi:MAG: hypothetical protein JW762_16510 [Dehalococcoidales bacterium]|nr:hypothetical protein [Dehalococcoidales bacterium]
MKGVVSISLTLLAVVLAALGAMSCMPSMTKDLRDTSVQVWVDGYPEGTGIIIVDGTEALTIMDYHMSPLPDNVYVVYDSREKYEAAIQRVDFRTGATLLTISGGPLPVAKTGSALNIKQDDKVLVYGWSFSIKDYEETEEGKKPVFDKVEFSKAGVTVTAGISEVPLSFQIKYNNEMSPKNRGNISQADIVTDGNGIILGLVSSWNWGIEPISLVGYLPPVVSIDSMLELRTEYAEQKVWTKGPSGYSFIKPGGTYTAYGIAPPNYEAVATRILILLGTLGEPMETDGLLKNYFAPPFGVETGYALVAVYASPIEITPPGEDAFNARWVILRWSVPGESNSVIYGMEPYEPEGAFEMTGDISILESLIDPEP